MESELTTEIGCQLTWRWHDGVLDLESLRYDKDAGQVQFTVLEVEKEGKARRRMFLVWRRPVYACRVILNSVSAVRVIGVDGHPELYIEKVAAAPDRLRIEGVNGAVEIQGAQMRIDCIRETTELVENEMSLLLLTVAWRAKAARHKRCGGSERT